MEHNAFENDLKKVDIFLEIGIYLMLKYVLLIKMIPIATKVVFVSMSNLRNDQYSALSINPSPKIVRRTIFLLKHKYAHSDTLPLVLCLKMLFLFSEPSLTRTHNLYKSSQNI